MSKDDGHGRCERRLGCPCWEAGAREEGEMHRSRPGTRELTDYIRVLGDVDPALSVVEVADKVARVFGSPRPEANYEQRVQQMAEALHVDCTLLWSARQTLDPVHDPAHGDLHGPARHFGQAHDLVRRVFGEAG